MVCLNALERRNLGYMNKADYRQYFGAIKPYVKFSNFLKMANVNSANFCYFMKGSDYDFMLSETKLDALKAIIEQFCSNYA